MLRIQKEDIHSPLNKLTGSWEKQTQKCRNVLHRGDSLTRGTQKDKRLSNHDWERGDGFPDDTTFRQKCVRQTKEGKCVSGRIGIYR